MTWGHTHQECVPQHPCHIRGMGASLIHKRMGVAANVVSRGDDGWGWLLTTYAAWRCARSLCVYVVLAANEVSEAAVMTMGVAAHHSPAPVPRT